MKINKYTKILPFFAQLTNTYTQTGKIKIRGILKILGAQIDFNQISEI
jgi:hypothetical protein